MARIKDSSVEAVKAAADFVGGRRGAHAAAQAGRAARRPLPVPRGAHAELLGQPGHKLYYCFGCHKGGDMIRFVARDAGPRLTSARSSGSPSGSAYRSSTRTCSPEQAARRDAKARLLALLDQAASFYERALWESEVGSYARDYLKGRGLSEEICREFRLGLSLGGDSLARKALAKGFSREELLGCRADPRRAAATTSSGGSCSRSPIRAAACSASRRASSTTTTRLPAKYVNTRESELFHKGAVVYGLDKARAAIAKQDRACVVEGNTDVIALRQAGLRAGRRVHGHRADRRAAAGARPPDEAAVARVRRRCRRRVGCAARDGARGRAGLRREGRRAHAGRRILPTTRAGSRRSSPARSRTCSTACASSSSAADDREAGLRRAKSILDGYPEGPDKDAAQRLVSDQVGTTVAFKRGATPIVRSLGSSPRALDAGSRLEQNALAGVVAFPALKPYLAEMGAEHFYDPANRALRAHMVSGAELDRDTLALLAELDARADAEGIDEGTATELLVRLRERELRRQLQVAEPSQTKELQDRLTRLLEHAVRPA